MSKELLKVGDRVILTQSVSKRDSGNGNQMFIPKGIKGVIDNRADQYHTDYIYSVNIGGTSIWVRGFEVELDKSYYREEKLNGILDSQS